MTRLEQMLSFLEQDPTDSFTRYAVALEYMSRKEYRVAEDYLNGLRERDPNYVATYYQLGQIYTSLEEWDNAEEAYTTGSTIARKEGDLHALSELQAALDDLDTLR